jgi:hypothetical protein
VRDVLESPAEHVEALYRALGRLTVESAGLESRLRYVVGRLAGDDDAGWIIFEGQSVDWLISNAKAVLGEHAEMERWPPQENDRILALLPLIQEAHRTRNFMVHGHWVDYCHLGEDEGCEPRPMSAPADDRIFHVMRSRYRKGYQEREVAVVDVERLADRMRALARDLDAALKTAWEAWLGPSESADE